MPRFFGARSYSGTAKIENFLVELNFSALNFTDSRAKFQFFNLQNLWPIIENALALKLRLVNITTEPVEISELYQFLTDESWENHLPGIAPATLPAYNVLSQYSSLLAPATAQGRDIFILACGCWKIWKTLSQSRNPEPSKFSL